ncbi:hypothetical protein GMA43_02045 [Turicibacter sanguinis]|nr:hypothetical protein [Turicibacter sanguinis]MTH09205.1 hypothetical protein [Turicibacter sanguinis]MTH11693.1 hypothetical protein [Turicibacter sanguinis]MTH19119.1 hypothetical protein [Turicibacter sanguinis]MTH39809.1 hypothetical protein [Turicibacter sanguinis]
MLKQMSSAFFAPLDQYPSAGMFTSAHLISLLVCFVIVGVCLLASRKMQWKTVMKLTKILAVIITLLELIKIDYNFYFGYTWLDAWFPLSYCSLFIYALWLSGYGKGVFKKLGDAFIIMGALLGGIGFLIFPTTSLMRYPIWHYLCLYSLFFHTAMIYLSFMYLKQQKTLVNRKTYVYFSVYFMIGAMISIILNVLFGSNIMLLREPFNVPFAFVHEIQKHSQVAYTLLAMLAYLVGPALFSLIVKIILARQTRKFN